MNTTTSRRRPTWGDEAEYAATRLAAPPLYGPPVAFLAGPWLILVLLLVPPFALLFTIALVLAVGAALLVAAGAVLASPYLLVRHLRAQRADQPKPAASPEPVRKPQLGSRRIGAPHPKAAS